MDYRYVRANIFGIGFVDAPTARPLTEAEIRWAYQDLPAIVETDPSTGTVTVIVEGAGPAYLYFTQPPADWNGSPVTAQHFAVPPF
ncbi:hypothetical protein [Streptomyces sp. NPDC093589]|uniref:hypothetical protein n=1 Tax=Streptomyces sp. NPDC093589 TaxID=3366043 RepID=UPI0038014378